MLTFSFRKFLRLLRTLFIFGLDVLLMITVAALLGKWVIGEQWEVIAALNSILHLLLMGGIGVLVINLIWRRWKAAAIGVMPVIYFVLVYGAAFTPDRIQAEAVTADLKVLNYNIHSERDLLEPIIAIIREADADLVALQELSMTAAIRFHREFRDEYPYRAFHTLPDEPIPGQGVMSRYPITADDYWRNESLPSYLGQQRVEIDINGTALTFYNAHPIHPIGKHGRLFNTPLRTSEIQSVLERALVDSGLVLIVGDFNMSDQSEDYQRVTAHFADTYRAVGWGLGFTFPDFGAWYAVPGGRALPVRPLVRLDYQFHSDGLQPLSAEVWGSSGGSDHRPLLAEYDLVGR